LQPENSMGGGPAVIQSFKRNKVVRGDQRPGQRVSKKVQNSTQGGVALIRSRIEPKKNRGGLGSRDGEKKGESESQVKSRVFPVAGE